MSVQKLPVRPNLRHLRLQAKTLLKNAQAGDKTSLKRLALRGDGGEMTLGLSQRAIARYNGFRSWRSLKEYVAAIETVYTATGAATPELLDYAILLLLDWRHHDKAATMIREAGAAGLKAIERGLQHRSTQVRRACAQYLDHHADASATVALKFALHDPVPCVRAMAAHAIACERCKGEKIDPELIRSTINMLRDPSPEVRGSAAWTLGAHQQHPDVLLGLVQMLCAETDPRAVTLARYALGLHTRFRFAKRSEAEICQAIGAPFRLIERRGTMPRILIYDPRSLVVERIGAAKVPTWLRIILDDKNCARSICFTEQIELPNRKQPMANV
jgi:hypothetical protein